VGVAGAAGVCGVEGAEEAGEEWCEELEGLEREDGLCGLLFGLELSEREVMALSAEPAAEAEAAADAEAEGPVADVPLIAIERAEFELLSAPLIEA
jgi:hypothetical protein